MKPNLLVLGFALSTAAWGAQVTLQPGPDATYVDLMIGGLGDAQVGAYDISIDYNPMLLAISAVTSLGSLGISGVETFFQTQSTAISPSIQRLQLIEVSLLAPADLIALQFGTFGLARLSLPSNDLGTALLSMSGTISDSAGDPVNTTFNTGQVASVPEPGTLSLLMVALTPILFRVGFRNGGPRGVPPVERRRRSGGLTHCG